MELMIEGNTNRTTVRIVGPLEITECQPLRESILELCNSNRRRIWIDLTDTDYIDTAGIGVLISLKNTLLREGGNLFLTNPRPNVLESLQTMRLDAMLMDVNPPPEQGP